MKKFLFLALGLTSLGLLLSFFRPPFFETLEGKLYDAHFAIRGPMQSSGRVVLATIDEKSLQKYGRWPWSRALFAAIFKELLARGARVVSPDIFFAEPSPGLQGQKNDEIMSEVLIQNPAIFTGYFMLMNDEELRESAVAPQRLEKNFRNLTGSALPFEYPLRQMREAAGIQDTLPLFSNLPGGRRQGFFNIIGDPDGTVRKAPLLIAYGGKTFPSLTLQIAMSVLGRPGDEFLSSLRLDSQADFLINYRGGSQFFPRTGIVDLLEGTSGLLLEGRVVLFGATAAGLEDFRPTTIHPKVPSVVLSANVLDNLLTGDFLRRDGVTDLVSRILIVAVGLLLGFSLSRLNATLGFFLFLAVTVTQALLLHFLFREMGWVLQNIYPLFSGFLVYSGTTLYRYLTEEKEKRFISDTFQHYLSADVIRELTENPDKIRLGGERKELTVFFSDIRDFASIVEVTPPEILVGFLNSYLTPVTDIILDNKGLLDKYIGDAVMAVFGAPLPEPDHRRLACKSAVEIVRLVNRSNEKWQKEFKVPKLKIGIGINTGVMTVGNMGSERRFDYTVMGDPVNLASRLEGLNKFYQTTILVSHATYEQVRDLFRFRELDQVQVKGRRETDRIYELLAEPDAVREKMFSLFQEGLLRYREGKFGLACVLFEKCLSQVPEDGPSRVFLERCRQLQQKPPEDWAGVTTFLQK